MVRIQLISLHGKSREKSSVAAQWRWGQNKIQEEVQTPKIIKTQENIQQLLQEGLKIRYLIKEERVHKPLSKQGRKRPRMPANLRPLKLLQRLANRLHAKQVDNRLDPNQHPRWQPNSSEQQGHKIHLAIHQIIPQEQRAWSYGGRDHEQANLLRLSNRKIRYHLINIHL